MFAALSGSSPATVVAIGSIAIAGMIQVGYSKEFAAGVICNAGTLGILIPPSIVMVVYAAATDVSVGRMFLAGVVPGLMAGGMLMLGIYAVACYKGLPAQPWAGWSNVLSASKDASWGLLLIVIILGGIYGGIFTPTEAAAVAAVYAFLIANFIYRDMGPFKEKGAGGIMILWRALSVLWHKDTKHSLFEAGKLTIMLLFIIANALILKHVLTEERIPQMLTEVMLNAGFGPIMFLIVVNILLLIGGQFMEPSGLLIIVAPLVFPIAMELGIDPIHLGIIMVVNMEIGMITPPVGLNLFVTAGVARMPMHSVVKAAAPWLAILFVFLIIVTYVPVVSTWLPTLMMGPEVITK
jgi:C4-dicarboxylate transporter DctM subunit